MLVVMLATLTKCDGSGFVANEVLRRYTVHVNEKISIKTRMI